MEQLSQVFDHERVEAAFDWLYRRIHSEAAVGDLEEAEHLVEEYDPDVPGMDESEGDKQMDVITGYGSTAIDYDAISVPVLAMYGEREMGWMVDHAEHVADSVQGAEARAIPDAGHNSHVDNPDFVTEAVRTFVREHVQAADSP